MACRVASLAKDFHAGQTVPTTARAPQRSDRHGCLLPVLERPKTADHVNRFARGYKYGNCIFNSYFIRELEYDFVEMPRFDFGIISHSDGGCPIILVLVTILEKVDLIVLGPHEHLDCSPDGMEHHFVAEAVAKIVESLPADSRVPKVTMLDSGH